MIFRYILCFTLVINCAFAITLQGSGATFVSNAITELGEAYRKKTGITINYVPIGSAGGIKQALKDQVDFGVTEIEYKLEDNSLQLIPFLKGNIVLAYNLEGISNLTLSTNIVAKIYLGEIVYWNNEEIVKLNPSLNLPSKKINIFHRYDGSGTTFAFTKFLSENNHDFKDKFGIAMTFNLETGVGKKGNLGIANAVKETDSSIGYVGFSHAKDLGLKYANLLDNSKIYRAEDGEYPLINLSYFFFKTNAEKSKDVRRFIDFIYRNGDEIIKDKGLSPLNESNKTRISIN